MRNTKRLVASIVAIFALIGGILALANRVANFFDNGHSINLNDNISANVSTALQRSDQNRLLFDIFLELHNEVDEISSVYVSDFVFNTLTNHMIINKTVWMLEATGYSRHWGNIINIPANSSMRIAFTLDLGWRFLIPAHDVITISIDFIRNGVEIITAYIERILGEVLSVFTR